MLWTDHHEIAFHFVIHQFLAKKQFQYITINTETCYKLLEIIFYGWAKRVVGIQIIIKKQTTTMCCDVCLMEKAHISDYPSYRNLEGEQSWTFVKRSSDFMESRVQSLVKLVKSSIDFCKRLFQLRNKRIGKAFDKLGDVSGTKHRLQHESWKPIFFSTSLLVSSSLSNERTFTTIIATYFAFVTLQACFFVSA